MSVSIFRIYPEKEKCIQRDGCNWQKNIHSTNTNMYLCKLKKVLTKITVNTNIQKHYETPEQRLKLIKNWRLRYGLIFT